MLKAAHVVAVLVFVSGVAATSLFLASLRASDAHGIAVMRRWDTCVTTPAMLFVWALGLTLAITGHWFAAPWLITKMGIVALISAAHGVNSGRLRRRTENARASGWNVHAGLVLGAAALAVLLVVVKPI
jgi:uncharacterized membrane protein